MPSPEPSDAGTGSSALFLDVSPSEPDNTISRDAACIAEEVAAEELPLDLYLMVDRSGSMAMGTSPTPWESQSKALFSFFEDKESAGMWIALNFFPAAQASSSQPFQGAFLRDSASSRAVDT